MPVFVKTSYRSRKRLIKERLRREATKVAMAKKCKISFAAYSKLEKGESARSDMLEKASIALNLAICTEEEEKIRTSL